MGDWQNYVKTWFNQPARKIRRRQARVAKAARIAPRPLGKLQPVVHCPTYKYNVKVRAGKGFTLEELKAAGLSKDYAPEELSKAVQLAGAVMPIKPVVKRARAMAVTDELKNFQALQTIRQARAYKRLHGIRAKKAADAEADNIDKKK